MDALRLTMRGFLASGGRVWLARPVLTGPQPTCSDAIKARLRAPVRVEVRS